jgi:hypothetical protein
VTIQQLQKLVALETSGEAAALLADCQRQLQLAWRDLAELRAENERLKLETMAAKKREEHTRKELGHCHLALLALEGKMKGEAR